MPKPWEKYQTQNSSGVGPWTKYQQPQTQPQPEIPEVSGPGKVESYVRGLSQGFTGGFSDETAAVPRAIWDRMTGGGSVMDKGFGDAYTRNRDAIRAANLQAHDTNPKTYLGGQVTGAVAPVVAATALTGPAGGGAALGRSMATMGAMGAIEGAGYSTAEDMGGMGKDILKGGAIGAAMPPTMRGVGKLAKGLMRLPGAVTKHATSSISGVKPQDLATKWANPTGVAQSPTMTGLATKMSKDVGRLEAYVTKGSQEAKSLLDPKKSILKVSDVDKYINDVTAKHLKGAAPEEAAAKHVRNFGKSLKEAFEGKKTMTEVDVHNWVEKARLNKIEYDLAGQSGTQNELYKGLGRFLDQSIKKQNLPYRDAMKPVAIYTRLLKDIKNKMKPERTGTAQYQPTDTTISKLKQIPSDKKVDVSRLAERVKKLTGQDYGKKAGLAQAREGFDAGKIGLGGPFRFGGEGSGGYMAEKVIGGVSQVTKQPLDALLKVGANQLPQIIKKFPQMFGQYAPLLQQAAERGAENLAVTHYTLQQMDPEYRKQLENIRDRSGR